MLLTIYVKYSFQEELDMTTQAIKIGQAISFQKYEVLVTENPCKQPPKVHS